MSVRRSALLLAALLVGSQASAGEPAPTPAPSASPVGDFQLKPRGMLVINALYGSRALLPGPFALFAVRPAITGDQFVISPNNTTVGFGISGVSFGSFAFDGALDVTLKSPTPLATPNILGPQFYDAYVAARSEFVDLVLGLYPDVILPFVIPTTNAYPGSYLPGQLGSTRPQAGAHARLPLGELFQLRVHASLGRPITTFQLTDELFGASAGLPDVQGRVALAVGPVDGQDELRPRPYELGLAAHAGRRRLIGITALEVSGEEHDSWSIGGDLRAELPTGTIIKLRVWRGVLLGDYTGGVFQNVSVVSREPVSAHGFLAAVGQALGMGWQVNVGFGRDDPNDSDVGGGERTLNEAGFANVFWNWSKSLGFALEGSRWNTVLEEQGPTRAWRGELLSMTRF
jgi:hypothetical protein